MFNDSLILLCPACNKGLGAIPRCPACGFQIDVIDGIVDLRTDKNFDTFLDTDSYDANHGVSDTPDLTASAGYFRLLESNGRTAGGRLLEIAAGSGYLTSALLFSEKFDEVHCGDISLAFMRQLSRRVSSIQSRTKLGKYLFDANRLPFADQSFDCVFGNSVLHHFAHFENTIRDTWRVLRPGGAAVFAEPLLDSHAFVSLAAGLIERAAVAMGREEKDGMTLRHMQALRVLRERATVKLSNLRGDRDSLHNIEDKFVFPAEFLRRLGAEIGFSRVIFEPPPKNFDLGREILQALKRSFGYIDLPTAPLDVYAFVFEAFTEDFGRGMENYVTPVFSRIAFIR